PTPPAGAPGPRALRRQALDDPRPPPARVHEPVVQAILAVLPELEALRRYSNPAPRLGQGQLLTFVLRRQLGDARLQSLPAGDRPALRRGERAELTPSWARAHVGRRLLGTHALGRTLDPDLAAERIPVEQQRRTRILVEIARLATLVVREDHEP